MKGGAFLGMRPDQGGDGYNISVGDSTSNTQQGGTSDQSSVTEQRVEEHAVAPKVLRSLSTGCLLLVEFGVGAAGRRVVCADVSPELATRPRVLTGPLPPQLVRLAELTPA
jgi:hypothetical protein